MTDDRAFKRRKVVESADALEDGLEYDVGSDDAGDLASIADSGESEASIDEPPVSKKEEAKSVSKAHPEERKAKRKLKKQVARARKKEEFGDEMEQASTVLSVDQQADLFAGLVRTAYASSQLSALELHDLTVPAHSFLNTESWTSPRTLDSAISFLRQFSPREKLEISNKECGRPHTLLLTSSAIRVADLVRALKPLVTKTSGVAKLFGKEKRQVQSDWLNANKVGVAVALPARAHTLVTDGALRVDRIEQIVLDASYRDAKKRGMLKIKEVANDLVQLLNQETIAARIKAKECQIVFF